MFTGIITDVGTVRAIEKRGDTRFRIGTAYDTASIAMGASIACSGVCLTVVAKGDDWFDVDVSAETLSRTTLGEWQVGTPVNLERSLKLGDELGGHIVTGHVDGVGVIHEWKGEGDSQRIVFRVPGHLAPHIAEKGSIAVNGVSLTVNHVADLENGEAEFGINIIPHTLAHTTFGVLDVASRVNIEIDILTRYVARLRARE